MSADESTEAAPAETFAIGISFGNSNSSIAYTSGVGLALNQPSALNKSDLNMTCRKEKQK